MTLRTRIFIVASLIVLAILGISMIVLLQSKKDKQIANEPVKTTQNNDANPPAGIQQTIIPAGVTVKPPTEEEIQDESIKQLAKVFLERFNTYSTDNSYQNVRDVKSLVTSEYWKKISANINNNSPAQEFTAVTTKVVSIEDLVKDSEKASVVLKTQKSTEKSSGNTISYSEFTVSLQKTGGTWKISGQLEK